MSLCLTVFWALDTQRDTKSLSWWALFQLQRMGIQCGECCGKHKPGGDNCRKGGAAGGQGEGQEEGGIHVRMCTQTHTTHMHIPTHTHTLIHTHTHTQYTFSLSQHIHMLIHTTYTNTHTVCTHTHTNMPGISA